MEKSIGYYYKKNQLAQYLLDTDLYGAIISFVHLYLLEHLEEEEALAIGDEEDTGAQGFIAHLSLCFIDRNKSKLYWFDKDGNQWKEMGASTIKFLKHKVTSKVRLLMRQPNTLKI
ncbi:unnamed protein product [Vicia faba]|uniref:RanBD1 domain-containing protein n=1 Tax=Vicia faba TaxID=3906 RepID=A0AAV0ZA94_VICFA|nr:unnamed protein product [Vicia faba]